MMLFLVSNPRVVSLDVAAKILIGEDQGADQDKNKFKSEYRVQGFADCQYRLHSLGTSNETVPKKVPGARTNKSS